MQDFVGHDLSVGDYVVFTKPDYRVLVLAQITGFSAKSVHVSYEKYPGLYKDYLANPEILVKVSGEDAMALLLKGKKQSERR